MTVFREFRRERLQTIATPRGQSNARAGSSESDGERPSDAARSASDEGDATVETERAGGVLMRGSHGKNDTVVTMNSPKTSARSFIPSGLITLTSDFGLRDPFVGVMKGRILDVAPSVRIVDLTHEILAHWPAEAGFWLARCFRYFAAGTVHVAVVDPGVGTARDIAIVKAEGHIFLAPDNGLLADVVGQSADAELWHLDASTLASLGVDRPSATFHGRDIFAPVAASIATGRVDPTTIGRRVASLVPSWVDDASITHDRVTGVVITIDHFGNLITNIDRRACERLVDPVVHAGKLLLPLRRTYGDVRPGDPIALINSFGVIEIAVAEGRAVDVLGLSRGAPVSVRDGVRRS